MARNSNQFPAGGRDPGEPPSPDDAVPATGSIHRDGSPSPSSGDESSDVSPFQIGDTLAGRYKIKRFLGRGGMGEVFEVEDLVLHSSVALKTIRPREADRAGAIDRFKREINVARRVTHPNVCRLFDVGSHQSVGPDGKTRETLFLTMEMLEGENLSDRISRGRIPIEEALPILNGMAQGLGAAHRAGVLHRDFKAANVMIGTSTESGRNRAVVTDFGLARTIEREEGLASISDSGVVVGTPAYMSPEQVRGETLTSASDIYALGLVLYEMVTGTRPFAGGSAWSIAVRRLTEEPPQPRAVVPDLDPGWDAAINACLQIDPLKRPRTPEEVVEMVKVSHAGDETHAIRSSPRIASKAAAAPGAVEIPKDWRRDPRAWGGAVGMIGLVVVGLYLASRTSQAPTGPESDPTPLVAAQSVKARPSILVLNFDTDGPHGSIGTAVEEVARVALAANSKVRVLPSQEALRAIRELGLGPTPPSPSSLAQIRVLLGVDFVLSGTASALEGGEERLVRAEMSLFDARSGQRVALSQATGAESSLPDLVRRAQADTRKALSLEDPQGEAIAHIEAAWPASPEVSRLTADGVTRLRNADYIAARDAFTGALASTSDHWAPHAGLAQALASLGYAAKAGDQATLAIGLSDRLAPEQRLWVNAQMEETRRDWAGAVKSYRSLLDLAPDNLDYGIRLADAQISGGRAGEALETIQALRRLPDPLAQDARLDLTTARAYRALGDTKQQLDFATRAEQRAMRQQSRITAAAALMLKSVAQEALGDRRAGSQSSEQAQRLFEAAGDANGTARAIERTAASAYAGGDLEGARRLYERVLTLHKKSGDRASLARVVQNLASLAYRQGDRKKADALDNESIAAFREIGAKAEIAGTLNNIAIRLQTAGDLAGAQKKYTEAIATFSDIGDRRGVASALGNVAEVLLARGELKNAEGMLEESLTTWRELGDSSYVAYILGKLGDLAVMRGDLLVARGHYDEALKTQESLKEGLASAETRLALARLSLWAAKPSEAEAFARDAEEVLRAEKAADGQILARSLVAEAQLAQGKVREAKETAEQLTTSAPQSRDANARVAFAILSARLLAEGGDVPGALGALERARTAAAKDKLADHELRVRLAAGEIEMKGGRERAGRARLGTLAKDAEAKGFGLIARKAREAAGV